MPETGGFASLRGPLGEVVFRPWFDWVAVRAVAHGYLPLSRAWAAALSSDRSVQRFLEVLPGRSLPPKVVAWALRQVEDRRRSYEPADRAWLAGFFGPRDGSRSDLVGLELARHGAAHRLMAARCAFLPLVHRLPAVKWQVTRPAEVEARHASRLASPAAAFPAPRDLAVEASRSVEGPAGPEHWLRFHSPTMDDTAWARVSAPAGVADPPTLIFLHGIAMENDMWRGAADPLLKGAIDGVRVIRPEGPWHGRRRPDGWYGGEPAFGLGPRGFLELFEAWVGEVAVLTRWARRTSKGPVALGGVSLGALTSQLAAVAAHDWPDDMRADALFLVATSGQLLAVAEDGSLARAVKLQSHIRAQGWTRDALARWL
ncbi:MAG: alpha/beta fold hydrolase, partial [Planctomycetota bacterium]